MSDERNVIDLLLDLDPPKLPEKEFKVKRLSKLCGSDVVFTLRALPYSRVAEIKKLSSEDDMSVNIVLAGVVSPNLRDSRLCDRYNAPTPAELLKSNVLLLPGEIEDISREIERLSGYRTVTVEEIKKK